MINKDAKILCIVESPNKRETITKIFKDGGYTHATVLASKGHITEIKAGGTYWNTGIDPKNNFKTSYTISQDKKEVVNTLKTAVEKADIVLLATDPDREGEDISWHLKNQLKITDKKYQRITFHEITKPAIMKALEEPRKINTDLVKACEARRIIDRCVGFRLTPIGREEGGWKSIGRCQSAALKIVADREEEILNFKIEKYYDLYLNFEKNKTQFRAKYFGTSEREVKRISTLDEVDAIKKACTGDYIISSIDKKEVKENSKPPFTTSTFQQEANRLFGMSIDMAMSCAQKLFEGISISGEHVALITYIRTDDSSMSPEFADNLAKYVKTMYGKEYYAPVKKGTNSDTSQEAHECLRVINLNMKPSDLEKYISDKNLLKIYRLIWLRTVQSSMAPAIIGDTQYTIMNNDQKFIMHSREIIFDGYRKVASDEEDQISSDEIVKESFEKEEKLLKTRLLEELKQTNPPKRYTEGTLTKRMEELGIGRPATTATIIKTILSADRGYCTLENKYIVPTTKGLDLSHFLDKSFSDFINLDYTKNMEKDLDLVAKGSLNDLEFLNSFYTQLEDSANKAVLTPKVCPNCGAPLVKRKSKFGPFWGCSNYPKCKYIEPKK